MKARIIISLSAVLFIGGDFVNGCEEEEEKPDYITVNVASEGQLLAKDAIEGNQWCSDAFEGTTIRVDVIKAGGERFNLYTVADEFCNFSTDPVSFKLYREQPIEIIAYAEQVPGNYTQVRGVDYLSWDEVFPAHDFGDTYNYTSSVKVIWLYTSD